jgi:hypothetical protein
VIFSGLYVLPTFPNFTFVVDVSDLHDFGDSYDLWWRLCFSDLFGFKDVW